MKWEHRQPRGNLKVNDLHALTDEAQVALWRHLAETDLVSTVVAEGRSPSERLPWLLTNPRAAVMADVGEGMWVRLFDVARALEARSWERSGTLVLKIIDDEAGAPIGRALDVSPGGASCRPTDRSADLTVPWRSPARCFGPPTSPGARRSSELRSAAGRANPDRD